jgi:hypothetical protein
VSQLDAMIDAVKRLGRSVPEIATEAAPLVEAVARASAAAGIAPEGGEAWAPTKEGGRAMANAASHITAKAYGPAIRVTLTGPDVFHHYSKKKAEPARRVLPDGSAGLTPEMAKALEQAAGKVFDRAMGGR